MRLRREPGGLHFYDRISGVHALIDELPVPADQVDVGPEVASIALTNACDLDCAFCYAPKTPHTLDFLDLLRWCSELDTLGTLEVAFGGGEPTLYRHLGDLCNTLWSETELGISITTHGHHLSDSLIARLDGSISIIRLSIDAPEPLYSKIRTRPLKRVIDRAKSIPDSIPLGVNTVLNRSTIAMLDQTLDNVRELGAVDWLLLPETSGGRFTLSESDWADLDAWIEARRCHVELRLTAGAERYLSCPVLFANQPVSSYLHIGADALLRRCSYESGGIPLNGVSILEAIHTLEALEEAVARGE